MLTNFLQRVSGLILLLLACVFFLDWRPDITAAIDAMARESAACGSTYRVVKGDTLHSIALWAYGTGDYQAIFEANRRTLKNVARIQAGDKLIIPCLDGANPSAITEALGRPTGTTEDLVSAGKPATVRVLPLPDGGGAVFVSGANFAPFADPALPEGGMITEMVRLAMKQAEPDKSLEIKLVEDWSAHLGLLRDGRFDIGFPWYRPDCTKAFMLGGTMRDRCAGFEFSDPLFEIAIAFYVRAGDPLAGASTHGELAGHRLCRPATHFTFDLEQEGLAGPNATLVFAPHAADCLTLLAEGKADVASLAKPLAETAVGRLGLAAQLSEIPALASVQTLHAVAPNGNARALSYLARLNAGLTRLRETGRWSEIVARHFGDFGIQIR